MLVDAHCHLDLVGPIDAVQLRAAGVGAVVVAGVHPGALGAQRRALGELDGGVCCGLHPWRVDEDTCLESVLGQVGDVLDRDAARVVAIGETGLDHRRASSDPHRAAQLAAMRAQLALGRDLDLPVVLHVVGAHAEAMTVVRRDGLPAAGGVLHGFMGSTELAQAWVRLGLHLSVGGAVTWAMSDKRRRGLQAIDRDRLLVETDAPDQPVAGHLRGHPAHLRQVVAALAHIRGEAEADLGRATAENARRLFRLGDEGAAVG